MSKKILAFLLAAMMLAALAGCGKKDDGGSTGGDKAEHVEKLVIVDSEWDGVDMFQCDSWNDMQCLLADSLLMKDPETGKALPCIASKSVWAEDGKTWTLTIPEGMKYSTGEQVEPEDVKASVEWGLEVSSYADGYKNIESIEVSGRDVIFHLTEFQADMEFNFMQCFVGVIDKDELDTMSKEDLLWKAHPYGPFYLQEYSPGAYAVLKPNPGYVTYNPLVTNKGACKIDEIRVEMGGEDFTHVTGLKNGEYDVLSSAPADYLEELEANSDVVLTKASGASVKYFEMNLKNEFLADKNVRQAVMHAINYENIDAYTNEYYAATQCLIQSNCLNYDKAAEEYYKTNYGYSVEKAKALLTESGWSDTNGDGFVEKNGKTLAITFSSRDTDTTKIVAQSLQKDMEAVGIKMEITTQNWAYVNQDVRDGNFDAALLGLGWSEPMLLVDNFCNRNPECTNPDVDAYLALVAKARGTVDFDERTQVITQLQKMLFDFNTIVPLYNETDYRVWRADIKGIVYTENGAFYLNDVQ